MTRNTRLAPPMRPSHAVASDRCAIDDRQGEPVARNKQGTSNREIDPHATPTDVTQIRARSGYSVTVTHNEIVTDQTYKQEVPGSSPGPPIGSPTGASTSGEAWRVSPSRARRPPAAADGRAAWGEDAQGCWCRACAAACDGGA